MPVLILDRRCCRFNRILREKPRFPSFVGANAKDIVLKLMEHDVTRRLGCMADGEHEHERTEPPISPAAWQCGIAL